MKPPEPRRRQLARAALALGLMAVLPGCEELVYYPVPITSAQDAAIRARHPQAQPLEIAAADGVALRGWLLPGSRPDHPLVLYFGGNAEEVSWLLDHPDAFAGWDVALVNYRGYGRSDGRPREQDLLADAVAVYDHLIEAGTGNRRQDSGVHPDHPHGTLLRRTGPDRPGVAADLG